VQKDAEIVRLASGAASDDCADQTRAVLRKGLADRWPEFDGIPASAFDSRG
jgi:hypothetical protein